MPGRFALLLVLLAGCTPPGTLPCSAPLHPAQRIELFFGLAQGGTTISDAAWQDYVAADLTPRFPDGLTALDGQGQWRDPATGRIGREPSRTVLLITDPGPASVQQARLAADAYKRRFDQTSVGVATAPVCVVW